MDILAEYAGKRALVVLDLFQILRNRHEIFGMPMLGRRNEEAVYVLIPSTVSVQCLLRPIMVLNNIPGHRIHL